MAENTVDRKYGGGERKPLGPAPTWEQVLQRNSIERLKREKPLHTLLSDELDELSTRHYLEIPEEDIVRLKWYGLYHDKPKVGTFMLRIKIPAGLLPPESLRTIGEISNTYGEGYAELSTRQNVQLHFITLPKLPEILDKLTAGGLTTAGGCGDTTRNITGCPLEGVLATEAFDCTPVVEEAATFFFGNPEYFDLPRKQKFTISTCPHQCDMPEINCVSLIGVIHEGREGFAMKIGGGLSTVPRMARDLGVFVTREEAIEVMRALLDEWKSDTRYRLSRVKARMKFMVDDYGPEAIREKVEARLGRKLESLPAPASIGFTDHMGVHEQKQRGFFHIGVPVPVGIVNGRQLVEVADLVQEFDGDVRLTKQQNFVITGVPEARLDEVKERLGGFGFDIDGHPLHATAIACTGEPHCNFSVTETKTKMQELLEHLEQKWGDRLGNFKLNLDGCPHACSLHWVGDIGLMGTTARETVDGTRQAYDLFLRGGVGPEQAVGRPLVRRVPTSRVPQALDGLIGAWLDERMDETFRDFAIRKTDEELKELATGQTGTISKEGVPA
ncbi:MAG: nitrite/sulfite reductase [Actinobacteria bacterium]|nr:MAG: nitrite/sulfite reductase [Actinomycetota bacterium]